MGPGSLCAADCLLGVGEGFCWGPRGCMLQVSFCDGARCVSGPLIKSFGSIKKRVRYGWDPAFQLILALEGEAQQVLTDQSLSEL